MIERFSFSLGALFLLSSSVWASLDVDPMERDALELDTQTEFSTAFKTELRRSENLYEKKWNVLNGFQVFEDRGYPELVDIESAAWSIDDLQAVVPFINPELELDRYMTWNDQKIQLFKDRYTKNQLDYEISLKPRFIAAFKEKLNGSLSEDRILAGKRIVLDPGHMGGDFWDHETGKFVEIGADRVSEGELNLVTAHLVAQKLRELGAEVKLTHEQLGPVSSVDYKNYDILPYARDQLMSESDESWFEKELESSDDPSVLFKSFQAHSRVKKIFSEFYRGSYFILKADMQARIDEITAFDPDITLFIHYDATDSNKLQRVINRVKVYVPGSVLQAELASRKVRYQFLSHFLNRDRWNSSVRLSSEIAKAISRDANVPLEFNPKRAGETKVQDGVYARNLKLSKAILKGAQAYLECLQYDYADEFYRMAKKDRTLVVGDQSIPYSSRVQTVADAIVSGISAYFAQ